MTKSQFWDDLAERYAKKPVEDVPAYQRKLAATKARLTPTDVILDIGCGTGSLALELSPLVSQVHSLDISSEMLKIARQKAADQGASNITFHKTTLEAHAGFEPESFDGICAYNILHLLDDRPATLRRIFELLKPGGFFVSSTVCLGESHVPYRPLLTVMRWLGKAPRVYVVRTDTIQAEMREAGFTKVAGLDVGVKKTTAFIITDKASA